MTAEDKLHLIEYETAKFINSMKELGYERISINIHGVRPPEAETPKEMFRNKDGLDFNTYEKCNGVLTLFEYV